MDRCKFVIFWVGHCGSSKNLIDGICIRHQNYKCGSCGQQATRECDRNRVCMIPLCDDCVHVGEKAHGPRRVAV
jgi:hypothetical protein